MTSAGGRLSSRVDASFHTFEVAASAYLDFTSSTRASTRHARSSEMSSNGPTRSRIEAARVFMM
eukprot:30881-Pelagococcus_subviridis.AAC.6